MSQQFVVRLDRASSPGGVAFIGPNKGDGFKVDDKARAARFDDEREAERFADHFKGQWRGFHGFAPSDISVVAA